MLRSPCRSRRSPTTSETRSNGRPTNITGRTVMDPSGPFNFISSRLFCCSCEGAGVLGIPWENVHEDRPSAQARKTLATRFSRDSIMVLLSVKLIRQWLSPNHSCLTHTEGIVPLPSATTIRRNCVSLGPHRYYLFLNNLPSLSNRTSSPFFRFWSSIVKSLERVQ
jgi:hypothetical protein